jgi:hypothetical protein
VEEVKVRGFPEAMVVGLREDMKEAETVADTPEAMVVEVMVAVAKGGVAMEEGVEEGMEEALAEEMAAATVGVGERGAATVEARVEAAKVGE